MNYYDAYKDSVAFFAPNGLNVDSCFGSNYLFIFDSILYFGNSSPIHHATSTFPPPGIANPHSYKFDLATSNLDTLPDFPYGPSTASNYFTIGKCGYLMCGVGGMNGNRNLMFCPDSINSIIEIENSSMQIFPNPFNEAIKINSKHIIENYKIYNVLGKEVLNGTPNVKTFEIKTDKLRSGIYLFQSYSKESKKFIYQTIIKF